MRRKIWLSVAMAAVGAGCLMAAAFASPASSNSLKPGAGAQKKGGTMNLNMSATDVDFSDPSLAYGTISWQIEFATALKLYNYPDKPKPVGGKITPEGATGFPVVSANGKTYTITIKSGYKFSDGSPVTAKNYAFALNRALSKTMQSPAAPFVDTLNAANAQIGRASCRERVFGYV